MHTDLKFGPYLLRKEERLLMRDQGVVSLPPRAIDLLLLLIEAGGRLVTKEEILDKVWAGSFVEEANIAHQISTIRKALGDDPDDQSTRYIETLPRRGYRFVGRLSEPDQAPTTEQPTSLEIRVVEEARRVTVTEEDDFWTPLRIGLACAVALLLFVVGGFVYRSRVPARPAIRSLAVLPFNSLDTNPKDDFLSLGMAEAMINKLSALNDITVRPISAVRAVPPSSRDSRALAKLLEVDAILEGTVQRQGDRLRVTSRLVRAADGTAIWSGKFDERYTNLFDLQDELSERVATTLVPAIKGTEREGLQKRYTSNPEAYELFVRGWSQWSTFSEAGMKASVNSYRAAIEKDPKFVLPWVGLGDAYSLMGIYGPLTPDEGFALAREAATKASSLDPDDPEVISLLGLIDLLHDRNWDDAGQKLRRALAIKGDCMRALAMMGYYLQAAGKPDEALKEFYEERRIDPVWRIPTNDVLYGLILARRYDRAIRESDLLLAKNPTRPFALMTRGSALAHLGRYDEALKDLQQAALSGSEMGAAEEGWTRGRLGDRAGALRCVATVKKITVKNWQPFLLAVIYSGLGDKDEAFRQLDEAEKERVAFLFRVRIMAEFDPIRSDPRFAAFEQRLNLPQ